MRPAFSVVFLTTLSGAGQGLLIALFGVEWLSRLHPEWTTWQLVPTQFYVCGAALAVTLGVLGLVASIFHLGHPERAWRAIAMWRTSWLSRECLALPVFLATTFLYGLAHWMHASWSLAIGVVAVLASASLFICTAMIYACLRFLQEWATPLTLVNFVLLGCASGFTIATASAAWLAPGIVPGLGFAAGVLIVAACVSRVAALARNQRLHPRSTLQSATGIRAGKVRQISRGFTASAFNLHEFFHGQSDTVMQWVKWGFLAGAFLVPLALLAMALHTLSATLLVAACIVQYAGLVGERWFFFAQARHPQNLYYQRAA
ncbi:dimethyl sulfoxide reductase anchor subunit [Paraburkholderia sp. CNPSo 3274]|uniref:dimethyl sulfoxide reductase anchor subunit family protein n=1 Tax=Paraburkholderia sp. CNPSo 3274 TaxID=2940932 RepID=UPI0020B749C2|nr:DmsC/YnfH family molybdoenzyme membrane anchor subunit [Paraburkholderia sp. CNPSo 3274]MCP3708818.1 dimethyl sulfoxide reductase anchor subunit [Paraburkholderia sp. CNPSo 3274]